MSDYVDCYNYLKFNNFEEIDGLDFYNFIFPNNEKSGEYYKDFSHPNSVFLFKDKGKMIRRIMLKDTFEDIYENYVRGNNERTLCGGLTYRKGNNKLNNAQNMNALILDLDGVGLHEISTLFLRLGKVPGLKKVPMPTFIVLSGTGLHIYYVFDVPIELYPNIKIQLKALKYELTSIIWDYKSTSKEKQIQYHSINQSFRMVGAINSKYGNVIKAFKVGDRVTLENLNNYVKNKVNINKKFTPSKISKEQAKELYPEWYQRVVVEGNKRKKKWDIKSKQGYALYNWWLKRASEIKGGHRYFYMMCLVIYACKCDVPKTKLKKDLEEVFCELRKIEHSNSLTKEDIKSALETYDKEYYNFTIKDIEFLTDLRIEKNKRNYRKQKEHIKMMNFIRDEINQNKTWNKIGNGRKSKEEIVKKWRLENPTGRKIDCINKTGLSKMTVYKWWKFE